MTRFSGYIVANESLLKMRSKDLELNVSDVKGGPTFTFRDTAYGLQKWKEFYLSTSVPLADEIETYQNHFEYRVLVVIGYGKLVLLAERKRVIDYLLTHVLDRRFFPNYRKVAIFIDHLISGCTAAETEFLITSLHGRFSGASRNLRSMSLYGDDVTNSALYDEFHGFFNFHSCGVGRRLFKGLPRLVPSDEGEIVRVSHDGFINLNLNTRHQANELLQVVNHIVRNRWVEDWVPDVRGDGEP